MPSEGNAWFSSERHQNSLHHPQISLAPCFRNLHKLTDTCVHTVFMSTCMCVYVCCLHMCCSVYTCIWVCMCVPSLLACLTGSDTSVAFPGESGPVPNCQEINATDSALLLSPRIPPSPYSSVCPLCLFSFLFFSLCFA